MAPDKSIHLYKALHERLKQLYNPDKCKGLFFFFKHTTVSTTVLLTTSSHIAGVFGTMQHVEICNDGPVTIMLDSENKP